jgi:4'-phosphopantetheinyl transferase EntD
MDPSIENNSLQEPNDRLTFGPMANTRDDEPAVRVRKDWAMCALHDLFPPVCGVACQVYVPPLPVLPEAEARAVALAAEPRKIDFTLGRVAAREALQKIGHPPTAIPVGTDRAPIWPAGIIGSIAHTKNVAVAVVARVEQVLALGVDIEQSSAVTEDLWPKLFLLEERIFLQSIDEASRACFATAIFSVKEAFYKFQFPHTNEWLDFQDVKLSLNLGSTNCTVRVNRPLLLGGKNTDVFSASFKIGDALTLAAVSLPA